MANNKVDPIVQLQTEASFGRAVIDLVKSHGMVKRRSYRRKATRRKPKAAAAKPVAVAKKPAAKKKSNPLKRVKAEQPAA